MGSAAAFHLARRGRRVLGLEQFGMLHERGSSHGLTRIIRLAYHEHPSYVPLLRRSYELWHELEQLAGEQLLVTTGSIEGGPEDGPTFRARWPPRAARSAARGAGRAELRAAFRATAPSTLHARRVPAGWRLPAGRAQLLAHLNQAIAHGAELHFHEPVREWEPTADGGVRVTTDRATYEATGW